MFELTKKFISLPSYKDGEMYESPFVEYLSNYMTTNFPNLKEARQKVGANRENLFYTDELPCKVLVINQLDTVPPSSDWTKNPFIAEETEEKIFGLGASDSKGNIAAFVKALEEVKDVKGLSILWYVDEEYDFEGMKYFVKSDLARSISPEFVMSIDGSGLKLGMACRGLAELKVEIKTPSEHSARKSQATLYEMFVQKMTEVYDYCGSEVSNQLGKTTINVANLFAGSKAMDGSWSNQSNKTPSSLNATVEFRTVPGFDLEKVKKIFGKGNKSNISCEFSVIHNLSGYETNPAELSEVKETLHNELEKVEQLDPSNFGYIDISMLSEVYPDAKLFSFGAGKEGQAHAPDECVEKADLVKAKNCYQKILTKLCS